MGMLRLAVFCPPQGGACMQGSLRGRRQQTWLAQPRAGRVPAGNNGIVGIKPSVGRFSTVGVVPACYQLDCVSVFALSVEDGAEVARLMENGDVAGGRQLCAAGSPAVGPERGGLS